MIYSIFSIPRISAQLIAYIRVEQFIDGKWIDVTKRCQIVDPDCGGALLIADSPPRLDMNTGTVRKRWVTGEFRVSIPEDAPEIVRAEFAGKAIIP